MLVVGSPLPTVVCEIVEVSPGSLADRAGILPGDGVVSVNGTVPRDILEWRRSVSDPEVRLVLVRGGEVLEKALMAEPGTAVGLTVSSAVFDRVQTCDNHCEFCFIYQLPKGMRRSLYVKDDDYRLSFLFGNFTTLTRFTEADLERVTDERLSPLHVSVHAADPWTRAAMLRNERGGTSLRWLGSLFDVGIDVKMQIVLCPGVNDGEVLEHTLASLAERHPRVISVAIVPLGLSRHNSEPRMRVHTVNESRRVAEQAGRWQERFLSLTGRRVVHASDEFYVHGGVDVPPADHYEGFTMLEDGVGLVRTFLDGFCTGRAEVPLRDAGFFGSVDGPSPSDYVPALNPAADTGLRATVAVPVSSPRSPRRGRARLVVLTGEYGARVIGPAVAEAFPGRDDRIEVRSIVNGHFGGNTAVSGLLTHADILGAVDPSEDAVHLIPDTCLNNGRFLDGPTLADLQRHVDVEVLPADGAALRHRLRGHLEGRD